MQEGYWTAGLDIGREITQVSYMTEGMTEPETLETLFETKKDFSYLKDCLLAIPGLSDPSLISCLDLVLFDFTLEKAEAAKKVCTELGLDEETVHFQGTEEACIYFALNQERNLWNNDVIFFDFSKNGLTYYSLHTDKGRSSITAYLETERLTGVEFDHPSDKEFLRLAKERMEKRLISTVYLIGEGFYLGDWAKESLKYLCSRRRVFKGLNLYTKGASYAAYDRTHARAFDQVLFLCANRLKASVGIPVTIKGEQRMLYLAKAGMSWYEARALIEAIPDEAEEITVVRKGWKGDEAEETISLYNFPARERRMTRLEISLEFLNERHGVVTVKDLGFGSVERASGASVRKDIMLS